MLAIALIALGLIVAALALATACILFIGAYRGGRAPVEMPGGETIFLVKQPDRPNHRHLDTAEL